MKAEYIRVSTTEQNTDRQYQGEGFKSYEDKCSGSIFFKDREAGSKLLNDIDKGLINEVYVHSIDRLGRNTIDIMNTIQLLTSKGVNVVSKKEGLRTLDDNGKENPVSKLIIGVLGTIAEFELNRIKERQAEGIEKAKKRGAFKNNHRPVGSAESIEKFLSKPTSQEIIKRLTQGHSMRDIAKLCKCSVATVQKVKKYQELISKPKTISKEDKLNRYLDSLENN